MTDKNTATILFRFEEAGGPHDANLEIESPRSSADFAQESLQARFNPAYSSMRCAAHRGGGPFLSSWTRKACTVRGAQHRHLVMPARDDAGEVS